MDKIYKTWISQTFDVYVKHWWNKNKKLYKSDCKANSNGILILAKNEEDAISKYNMRYNIDSINRIIDTYWLANEFGFSWSKKSRPHILPGNFDNKVFAVEVENWDFESLKSNMCADDFLEYCGQRLYPVARIV